jgi:hypothetical protein
VKKKSGPEPGLGMTSRVPRETHPYRFSSIYFRTQEARDQYAWRDRLKKAARRAGWPNKTDGELRAFEEHRAKYHEAVRIQKEKDEAVKEERRKLKQELGVHPRSNMTKHALSPKAPALPLISRQAHARLSDTEKIELIKRLIEDRTPIQEFMIKTSQLVGAKL